jgi:uncharacterized protein (UPF0261 family)
MMATSQNTAPTKTTFGDTPLDSTTTRRLLTKEEIGAVLQLGDSQVQWLISTEQVRPIRIAGEIRFDSRELDALIETYKQIANRKENRVQ